MQSIVNLHIGQAGVQIGNSCWQLFAMEHGINPDGKMQAQSEDNNYEKFFSETSDHKFTPRSVFIDLEPTVIDEIKTGQYKNLFSQDQLFSHKQDASDLFSAGRYSIGKIVIDEVLNKIRKQVEKCQSFQGFILTNSFGGGTGSGFCSLLAQKLAGSYEKNPKISYSIFSSASMISSVVEPYNTILSFPSMLQNFHANVLFDNQSLYKVFQNNLQIDNPNYKSLNRIIAQVISTQTISSRFKGDLNMNLNSFLLNLIAYPRGHFLQATLAPLVPQQRIYTESSAVEKITNDLFDYQNRLVNSNPRHGKYVGACLMYRGDVTPRETIKAIEKLKLNEEIQFMSFMPTGFKVGINERPFKFIKNGDLAKTIRGGCMIGNTTAIAQPISRVDHKFDLMFCKRGFVHWYLKYQMEEGQFLEAREATAAIEKDLDYGGLEYQYEEFWGTGEEGEE